MFGSEAIDVVFGLIFVYLALSLICSTLNETLASILAWRADLLREGIRNLLGDERGENLARRLYEQVPRERRGVVRRCDGTGLWLVSAPGPPLHLGLGSRARSRPERRYSPDRGRAVAASRRPRR